MNFEAGQIYHIYNQGNNRGPIFFQKRNYVYFQKKMATYLLPYVEMLAYCLMPNHFHFLVLVNQVTIQLPNGKERDLNFAIGLLLRSYTRAINKQEGRTGSLFRAHTKAKDGWIDGLVTLRSKNKHLFFRADNDYARQCFDYIHRNPVKAGLVASVQDWKYSSARDYAGRRRRSLVNKKLAQKLLF